MRRRGLLVFVATLAAGGLTQGALFAGSYLDRAALLVFQASKASEFLRTRSYDGELARVVKIEAAARLKIAGEMLVPKEVVQAHPHLLLTLQYHERAANAAVEKSGKDFLRYLAQARDEEQVFRAVLEQLGWQLPSFG